jgi:ElaB/YqjD/DUF883 family membrane-anchored ribosome-binding protein
MAEARDVSERSPEKIRDSIRRTQHEMSETIHEIERRLSPKEIAEHTRESVRRRGAEIRQTGADMMNKTKSIARDKTRVANDFLHEQPLTAAMIAFVAGAVVGAVIPSTGKENELLGEQRDRLVDRASSLAHERVERAKELVREDMRDIARP